jgi:hypothetical protein
MKRADILATASEYVTTDRAATHGNAEDNFLRTAELWNAYLGVDNITSIDVAVMLALLKVARIRTKPQPHADNWIDIAGYAACGGEIATGD